MGIKIGGATDRGMVREQNEDSFGINQALGLAIVADGMGGHKAGEVASQMAVEIVTQKLLARSSSEKFDPRALASAVADASFEIFSAGRKDAAKRGMGSTIVALWLRGNRAAIAYVGDSRAYLRRGGEVRALTQDHTIVQELVNAGRLTPEEAEVHHFRNVLSRALGVEGRVEVDLIELDLLPGDRLMLCSDGLYGYASTAEMNDLLLRDPEGTALPGLLAQELVDLANRSGGGDNITAIVVEVLPDDATTAPDPALPIEEAPTETMSATVRLSAAEIAALEELSLTPPAMPVIPSPFAPTDPALPAARVPRTPRAAAPELYAPSMDEIAADLDDDGTKPLARIPQIAAPSASNEDPTPPSSAPEGFEAGATIKMSASEIAALLNAPPPEPAKGE